MNTKVYIADISPLEDTSLFDNLYKTVSVGRQQKVNAVRFDKDKRLSLGSEILLHYALSSEKLFPDYDSLVKAPEGKPFFPKNPDIQFSLSHSGTRVMLAVSSLPCGCDVQESRSRKSMKLAGRFFSPSEIQSLQSLPEEKQESLFFRLWTLKESFMKCTGHGLYLPMDSFTIHTESTPVTVEQTLDADTYYFQEYDFNDDYHYAVCLKDSTPCRMERLPDNFWSRL